jgi:hypothetical protein
VLTTCRFRLTCVAAPVAEDAAQQAAAVKAEAGQANGGAAGEEYEGLGQANTASGAIVLHH